MAKIKRSGIQFFSTVVSNGYFKGFMEGKVYAGPLKNACSPGLNCYSCPGALTSCPIGALQAVIGSARYWYSMYVVGILGVFGLVLGRWICGYLCPFGWFQEWLFKIKSRKCTLPSWTKKIKYVLLVVFVLLLPTLVTNVIGMGDPAYCKYICPVGTLEGGIPLILMNDFLKQALGFLFFWKLGILAMVIIASVLVYRPFCKVLCPLGAIYALFNKVSLYRYHVDIEKCVRCNRCAQVCKMDVVMYKTPNHTECIRCGDCKSICPTSAITSGINIDKAKSL